MPEGLKTLENEGTDLPLHVEMCTRRFEVLSTSLDKVTRRLDHLLYAILAMGAISLFGDQTKDLVKLALALLK